MEFSKLIVLGLLIGVIAIFLGVGMWKTRPTSQDNFTGETPPIDESSTSENAVATFSLGCFWGPDAKFGVVPGVVNTRVGYSGGTKKDPTYYSLGNHTETVQIRYNPEKISYENLLEIFWNSHDPTQARVNTQYKSIIFYHDENQETKAQESKANRESEIGENIATEIRPFENFYLAEAYHQKYHLQSIDEIYNFYKELYPNLENRLNSTALSRANGYAAGYGSLISSEELKGLGLQKEGRQKLYEIWEVNRRSTGNLCPAYFEDGEK